MPFIARLIVRVREWLGGYCSLEGGYAVEIGVMSVGGTPMTD